MSTILLVDDDQRFTDSMQELIALLGHTIVIADTVAQAIDQLQRRHFNILLLDIMLPDGNGFDVIEKLKQTNRPDHIAFITGDSAISSLIKSVAGPDISYLLKPINLDVIKALLEQLNSDDNPSRHQRHFGQLVGETDCMQQVYAMISRVAGSAANVMIQGESGTGKELVAAAIHQASACSGAFIATNCAAISPELLASELFGHEKGAFTGATARKIGLFEQAQDGTLFLDEITEMPIDMQPALLRVLETGTITRVGGRETIPVNCRVVSATNRTNQQLAEEQCLREDIYFRLAVFPIELPPLRDRKADIRLLAETFIDQFNRENSMTVSLTDADLQRLHSYDWPGNIRELRHTLYRAHIMSPPGSNCLHLPEQLGSPFTRSAKTAVTGLMPGQTIQEVEKELIMLTLKKVDGDKPQAAAMLGISLKTLYNRLNQYEQ